MGGVEPTGGTTCPPNFNHRQICNMHRMQAAKITVEGMADSRYKTMMAEMLAF